MPPSRAEKFITSELRAYCMHPLEVKHWTLVQARTRIRHDKGICQWLHRCWEVAVSLSKTVDRKAFDGVYKRLLTAMTIEWDDDTFRSIVDIMWQRDATTFADLNEARFCCSVFFFAEMWVEALEVTEYVRIFELIHRIILSTTDEPMIRRSNPATLAAFHEALSRDLQLAEMNVSLGKSTGFDPEQYTQAFGRTLPDAVSTVVASAHHKPTRRPSQNLSTSRHGPKFGVHIVPLRPRSCTAVVRVDGLTTMPASLITTRHLVVTRPRQRLDKSSILKT